MNITYSVLENDASPPECTGAGYTLRAIREAVATVDRHAEVHTGIKLLVALPRGYAVTWTAVSNSIHTVRSAFYNSATGIIYCTPIDVGRTVIPAGTTFTMFPVCAPLQQPVKETSMFGGFGVSSVSPFSFSPFGGVSAAELELSTTRKRCLDLEREVADLHNQAKRLWPAEPATGATSQTAPPAAASPAPPAASSAPPAVAQKGK